MDNFYIEDFVRQNLGDRDTVDYFPASGELEQICWRYIACRCGGAVTLDLCALEIRGTPLPTPGVSTVGSFWAYSISQYYPGIYQKILQSCGCDTSIDQPNHRYGLFQSNAYVGGVFVSPQPSIDEISLLVSFTSDVNDTVQLVGYPINLNRLMHGIFMAIADDLGKLAVFQSTLGGSTNLQTASQEAMRRAGVWLAGSMIYRKPLTGGR